MLIFPSNFSCDAEPTGKVIGFLVRININKLGSTYKGKTVPAKVRLICLYCRKQVIDSSAKYFTSNRNTLSCLTLIVL